MKSLTSSVLIGLVLLLTACVRPTPVPPATGLPQGYPEQAATRTPAQGYPAVLPTTAPAPGYPEPGVTETSASVAAAARGPVFITYRDFEIVPGETSIQAGTEVTFLIEGSRHQPYNFTGGNRFQAPNDLGNGTAFTYTFAESGTTVIRCGYHANMSAQVVVTP